MFSLCMNVIAVVQSCTVDSDCNYLNCPAGQDPYCHGNHCHCGQAHLCINDSDCHGHCNDGGVPACDDNGHCHCN